MELKMMVGSLAGAGMFLGALRGMREAVELAPGAGNQAAMARLSFSTVSTGVIFATMGATFWVSREGFAALRDAPAPNFVDTSLASAATASLVIFRAGWRPAALLALLAGAGGLVVGLAMDGLESVVDGQSDAAEANDGGVADADADADVDADADSFPQRDYTQVAGSFSTSLNAQLRRMEAVEAALTRSREAANSGGA